MLRRNPKTKRLEYETDDGLWCELPLKLESAIGPAYDTHRQLLREAREALREAGQDLHTLAQTPNIASPITGTQYADVAIERIQATLARLNDALGDEA